MVADIERDTESRAPEDLIRRIRTVDDPRPLLGQLLSLYQNYLQLLARTQMGQGLRLQLGASDVVQETMMEAHRGFAGFDGSTEAELLAWLRRILVRNVADLAKRHEAQRRDWRRRRSLETLLARSSEAAHDVLAAGISTPSAQAERREQAVLLADALASLPPEYREVIVLRHLERLGFEEVGDRLGRTSGAVRKLWARALLRLRKALHESP